MHFHSPVLAQVAVLRPLAAWVVIPVSAADAEERLLRLPELLVQLRRRPLEVGDAGPDVVLLVVPVQTCTSQS